jgi:hypothetical protein
LAMPLSPEDQKKIQEHTTGKLKACPMCGTNSWTIFPEALALPVWHAPVLRAAQGRADLSRVLPVTVIACDKCSLMILYPWGKAVGELHGG